MSESKQRLEKENLVMYAELGRLHRLLLAVLPVYEAARRQTQCDSPEAYPTVCRETEAAFRAAHHSEENRK